MRGYNYLNQLKENNDTLNKVREAFKEKEQPKGEIQIVEKEKEKLSAFKVITFLIVTLKIAGWLI